MVMDEEFMCRSNGNDFFLTKFDLRSIFSANFFDWHIKAKKSPNLLY